VNRRLFVKGFTFGWMGRRGEYREPYAVDSLRKLKDTGCESIALAFDTPQDTALSTRVYFDYESSPTDKDICFIIDKAHEIGMEVCLKPVINPRDGLWRAYIDFPDGADHYWKSWFASYRAYMRHYAEIAEETGCEMYCIGCEMVGTQRKTAYWREVIDVVRGVYNGIVTYNANHGNEDGIDWLGDLDLIGISGYYPVGRETDGGEEALMANWQKVKAKLYGMHQRFGLNIYFAEIGCRSAKGCVYMPWDGATDLPYDEEEQAKFYLTALKAFWDEPWFSGYHWWDWSHKLYSIDEAKTDRSFGIYGKKAEAILKEWYSKEVV
jgi:hypothetical protein